MPIYDGTRDGKGSVFRSTNVLLQVSAVEVEGRQALGHRGPAFAREGCYIAITPVPSPDTSEVAAILSPLDVGGGGTKEAKVIPVSSELRTGGFPLTLNVHSLTVYLAAHPRKGTVSAAGSNGT